MGFDPVTMGVVAATTVAVAGGASAISSIQAGKAEAKSARYQGEYNAKVYEQQAEMIAQQQKLQEHQANREAARFRGATIARIGKSGLLPSGSPLAVMIDNETQMELDKMIGRYNLDVERNYALSGAKYYRYQGNEQARLAKVQGYSNAFSTLLQTGSSMAMMAVPFGISSAATRAYGSSNFTFSDKPWMMFRHA